MVQIPVDIIFRPGIQRRCGLIQYQHGSLLIQRPGYGNLLCFSAGDLHAPGIEILIEGSLQIHGAQTLPEARFFQRLLRPPGIVLHTARQVLPQPKGKQLEVLKDHTEQSLIAFPVIRPDINAVHQDFPLVRIVQAAEQLNHGSLAAAVCPYHCQLLACPNRKGKSIQGFSVGIWVGKGDVAEFDFYISGELYLFRQEPLPRSLLLPRSRLLLRRQGSRGRLPPQILQYLIQSFHIGCQQRQLPCQRGKPGDELADSSDVLHDVSYREQPRQSPQPHRQVQEQIHPERRQGAYGAVPELDSF